MTRPRPPSILAQEGSWGLGHGSLSVRRYPIHFWPSPSPHAADASLPGLPVWLPDRVGRSQSPMFAPINRTLQQSDNFIVVKMRQSYETILSKAERRMGQEW